MSIFQLFSWALPKFPYMNRFLAPWLSELFCVFCPSSIEFVSVWLLYLCVFSKISSIGRASHCCLPFPLLFPHFSSLYIFIYFNFSDGHCQCSYILLYFLLLSFCPFSFDSVSFIFSKISSRWRRGVEKVGEKVESVSQLSHFSSAWHFSSPPRLPNTCQLWKNKRLLRNILFW